MVVDDALEEVEVGVKDEILLVGETFKLVDEVDFLVLVESVLLVLVVEDEEPEPEFLREKQLLPEQVRSNQARTVVSFV